ncbi:cytochrome c biogenesis protein CcsA [bacterium]|nr:cytochrome c biogenesis protein CcsA [bacterium]
MGFDYVMVLMIGLIVITSILWIIAWKKDAYLNIASIGNWIIFCLTIVGYLYFISLFISHQYNFQAVYQNTNNQMPFLLLISSSWAGQAGSLFLWLCMHSLTLLIALRYKQYKAYISPILLVNQSIILFLVYKAQPFLKTPVAFHNGIGLNPVLSHIYMSIHPPFAFLGYALISLLFAFTIAHLVHPIDIDWVVKVKKWVYCAFFCLSSTIILGSLWAYSVQGWGGLWAFDPIENASLVTWILLMVLIHHITWYQKRKIAPHFSLLLMILIFSSVYHMVMLLRSGLMEQLTQHAYMGESLLSVLLIIDIVYFLIPILIFCFRYKHIETDKEKKYFTSAPYSIFLFSFFMLFLAGLLFLQINQPLIQRFSTYTLPSLTSWFLPLFYVGVLGFLITNQLPSFLQVFHRNHHQLQLISMIVTNFLISLLLSFVFILLSGNKLTTTLLPIVFIFFSCLWIVDSVQIQKKESVKNLVDRITHIAISLLIISFTLSSTDSSVKSLFLLPSDTIALEKISISMKAPPVEKEAYIGAIQTYPIEMNTNGNLYPIHPSIWEYVRKTVKTQMKIPFIQRVGFLDMQVIPKQKNQIEFIADELVYFKDSEIVISNKIHSPSPGQEGLQLVSADVIIKKINQDSEYKEPYVTEVLHITKENNQSDIRFNITPSYSELLETELHWSISETNSILLQSADWNDGIQVDLVKKPFVVGIRFSYFLLLLILLVRILFFRYKKWGKQYLFPAYHHTPRRQRHTD